SVHDTTVGSLSVLGDRLQVVDGVIQTVNGRTKFRSGSTNCVSECVQRADSSGGGALRCNVTKSSHLSFNGANTTTSIKRKLFSSGCTNLESHWASTKLTTTC